MTSCRSTRAAPHLVPSHPRSPAREDREFDRPASAPVRTGPALPGSRHVRTRTRQNVRPFTATVGHLRGGPHTAENFRKRFVCGREVCLDGGDVPRVRGRRWPYCLGRSPPIAICLTSFLFRASPRGPLAE